MSEFGPDEINKEQEASEPTVEKLISALREIMPEIKDSEFEGMDYQDALGQAYGLLLQAGEDPDTFLAKKGFLENQNE